MKLRLIAPLAALLLITAAGAETMQAPPIKAVGIVVKKNPGTGANRAVPTDKDGIADITITERGNYIFTFVTLKKPDGTAQSGSDVKRVFNQGGSVKGVKVALGKNPPGARSVPESK
jgi:hypothetical protein